MTHLGAPGAGQQPANGNAAALIADAESYRTLHSQSTVYQGRIWDIVSDTFSLTPDSTPLTRDYIDHPGAVAVVVLNAKNQVLLLRQYRHPVQMNLWEIPAGLLDIDGEDFVVGAARELAGRIHNPSAVVGILAAAQAVRDDFATLRPGNAPWPEHPSNRAR